MAALTETLILMSRAAGSGSAFMVYKSVRVSRHTKVGLASRLLAA